MARFTVIDPAQLGPMAVIHATDSEARIRQRLLDVKERWTEYDPPLGAVYDVEGTEFDPIVVLQETGANFQTMTEDRVNQAANATTLAFATGTDLDGIGSRYPGGVPRLAMVPNPRPYAEAPEDWEPDERYRRRLWLSANAFSTAGAAEAYEFWALTAVPELRDATATVERTEDGPTVVVTCLLEGPDPVPTTDQLLAVRRMIHRPDVKPLTDVVSVMGPRLVDVAYDADVWLLPGAEASTAMAELESSVAAWQAGLRWLGADHTLLGFNGALARPAVHNVRVNSPTADRLVDPRGYVRVTGTTLTLKGRSQ